jgi:hypothetical protein
VEVSDLNGENIVTLGANQTTTVVRGSSPSLPISFDSIATDHWWNKLPSPSAFSLINLIGLAIAIIVILVVVGALVLRRNTKKKNQSYQPFDLPPPPPPPPPDY